MKAVIFAAGKGTRLRPLTKDTPKPMVHVDNQPILDYTIQALPPNVDEIIFVVNYLKDQIINYFGNTYNGYTITYVDQEEPLGTYHALAAAKNKLDDEPFLCLMGDDLYKPDDIERLSNHERAILVDNRKDAHKFGVCYKDENNTLTKIREKPSDLPDGAHPVYTGAATLTQEIFNEEVVVDEESGEQLLPPMIASMATKQPVKLVEATFWHPIGYPQDIEEAEKKLRKLHR